MMDELEDREDSELLTNRDLEDVQITTPSYVICSICHKEIGSNDVSMTDVTGLSYHTKCIHEQPTLVASLPSIERVNMDTEPTWMISILNRENVILFALIIAIFIVLVILIVKIWI